MRSRFTSEQRRALKRLIDAAARERIKSGYMDCDPESLTVRADEAETQGHEAVATALRNFRDEVVNPLLGMGLDLARVEQAVHATMVEKHGHTWPG